MSHGERSRPRKAAEKRKSALNCGVFFFPNPRKVETGFSCQDHHDPG